jgi:hypothetical protein
MAALRRLAQNPRGGRSEALRVFGSERELVLAAHNYWQVHLLARLDQVLEDGTLDAHDGVLRAVAEQSRAMPGLAALLREHADDPVLARGRRRLAAYVDQACPCGRPHPLVTPAAPARPRTRCLVVRAHRRMARCLHRFACRPLVVAPGA